MEWEYSYGTYKMNVNGVLHLLVIPDDSGMKPKGTEKTGKWRVVIVGYGHRDLKTLFNTPEQAQKAAIIRATNLLESTAQKMREEFFQ